MLGGQKAEFVLPSWMGKLTGSVADAPLVYVYSVGIRLYPGSSLQPKDRKKASLLPGTRWGMTYRRGSLELFMAMPDSELESLGCVYLERRAGCYDRWPCRVCRRSRGA